jgi:hypothetical protein
MRTWGHAALVLGALAVVTARADAQRLIDIRHIATDTLRDVALARFEDGRPTIYYNPALLQRLGPRLTAFFIAHEYGHIRRGHDGAALARGDSSLADRRIRLELEADCFAAELVSRDDPDAVREVVEFFLRMGQFRFDKWHPSGSQRAAKILSCVPPAY